MAPPCLNFDTIKFHKSNYKLVVPVIRDTIFNFLNTIFYKIAVKNTGILHMPYKYFKTQIK